MKPLRDKDRGWFTRLITALSSWLNACSNLHVLISFICFCKKQLEMSMLTWKVEFHVQLGWSIVLTPVTVNSIFSYHRLITFLDWSSEEKNHSKNRQQQRKNFIFELHVPPTLNSYMKEGWHFMNENKKLSLVVVKPQLRTSSTLSARPHAWYFNNKAEVTKCCVHIMDFTRLCIPHISVYLNSSSPKCNFKNYKYFRKWHCKWICHSLKLWHTLARHRTPPIISWFSPQNRICYYLLTLRDSSEAGDKQGLYWWSVLLLPNSPSPSHYWYGRTTTRVTQAIKRKQCQTILSTPVVWSFLQSNWFHSKVLAS